MYVRSTEPTNPHGSCWSPPSATLRLCGSLKSLTKYESAAADGCEPVVHDEGCAFGSATKCGTPAPEQLSSSAPVPVFEYANDIQLYGSRPVNTPTPPRTAVPWRTSLKKPKQDKNNNTNEMKA